MEKDSNGQVSIVRLLATTAALAAIVAAAVAWIAPDAGAAATATVPDDGVELVSGHGGPPGHAPAR